MTPTPPTVHVPVKGVGTRTVMGSFYNVRAYAREHKPGTPILRREELVAPSKSEVYRQQQQDLLRVRPGPVDDERSFRKRGIPTVKEGYPFEFTTRPGDGKQFRLRDSPRSRSPVNRIFELRMPKSAVPVGVLPLSSAPRALPLTAPLPFSQLLSAERCV